MRKNVKIIIICFIFLITLFSTSYSLTKEKGTLVGTKNFEREFEDKNGNTVIKTLTTTGLIDTAKEYYKDMWYDPDVLIDPTPDELIDKMDGKIQIYATHGSIDSIIFNCNTGISNGTTHNTGSRKMLGVSDIGKEKWKNNTLLVTYIACNTAGKEGYYSTGSLTFHTVKYGGAAMAIGFRDEIDYGDAKIWSSRFHEKLNQGEGVLDAMDYAGSDIRFALSPYGREINSWHLVWDQNKVNENIRITRNPIIDVLLPDPDIIILGAPKKENILKRKIQIENNDKENTVIEYLKNYDSEFDINNYEIKRATMGATSLDNSKVIEREFIYFVEKIGDFFINSGYIAKVENGKIISIIDDKIKIEPEKKASIEQYKISEKDGMKKVNQIEKQAIEKVQEREDNVDATVDKTNIRYYYDVKNDKKYMLVPYKEEIKDNDETVYTLKDTIMYEI